MFCPLKFDYPCFYYTSTNGPKQPTILHCRMSKHRKHPPYSFISSSLPKQWIEKQRRRKMKSHSKETTMPEMACVCLPCLISQQHLVTQNKRQQEADEDTVPVGGKSLTSLSYQWRKPGSHIRITQSDGDQEGENIQTRTRVLQLYTCGIKLQAQLINLLVKLDRRAIKFICIPCQWDHNYLHILQKQIQRCSLWSICKMEMLSFFKADKSLK